MPDPRKDQILNALLADPAWSGKSDDEILTEARRRYADTTAPATTVASTRPGREQFAREFVPVPALPAPAPDFGLLHVGDPQASADSALATSLNRLASPNPIDAIPTQPSDVTAARPAPQVGTTADFSPQARYRAVGQLRNRARDLQAAAAPRVSPEAARASALAENLQTLADREGEQATVGDIAVDEFQRLAGLVGADTSDPVGKLLGREAPVGVAPSLDVARARRAGELPTPEDLAQEGVVDRLMHNPAADLLHDPTQPDIPTKVATEAPVDPLKELAGRAIPQLPLYVLGGAAGRAGAGMLGSLGLLGEGSTLASKAPGVAEALQRFAQGGTLIGDAAGSGWLRGAAVRGAQEGVLTGSALEYNEAREEGASRGEAAVRGAAGGVGNVVLGPVAEVGLGGFFRATRALSAPLESLVRSVWARAPEGSKLNVLRDWVAGADQPIREALHTDPAAPPPTEDEVQRAKQSLILSLDDAKEPPAQGPLEMVEGYKPKTSAPILSEGERLADAYPGNRTARPEDLSVDEATQRLARAFSQRPSEASPLVTTKPVEAAKVVDAYGDIVDRKKVNGQDVYVLGAEGHAFGADAGTQVKNAVRAVDLDATPGAGDPLTGFRAANGYDRVTGDGTPRPASKVEASRLQQAIDGVKQRAARLGRTLTTEQASGLLAAVKPAKALALGAVAGAAELGAEHTDNPTLKEGLRAGGIAALGAALGYTAGHFAGERASLTDVLTGLRGQGAFLKAKLDPAYSWLVNDLDGFKRVNDLHGHAAGDAVLRSYGKALRAAGKAEGVNLDHIFRSGGDETAVRALDPAVLQRIKERMQGWREQVGDVEVTSTGATGRTYDEADIASQPEKQAKRQRRGDTRGQVPLEPGPRRPSRTAADAIAEAAAESPEDIKAGKLPGNYKKNLALAGLAAAGQLSDDERKQGLAALPLIFTSVEHGDLEVRPGEILKGGFENGKEAGKLLKEFTDGGFRGEVRRQPDGTFAVIAKGQPAATGTDLVKAEPTAVATVDRSLPMERNRPLPSDKGRTFQPDPQGRFISRMGQALENEKPSLKLTPAEWQERLRKSPSTNSVEVDAIFGAYDREHRVEYERARGVSGVSDSGRYSAPEMLSRLHAYQFKVETGRYDASYEPPVRSQVTHSTTGRFNPNAALTDVNYHTTRDPVGFLTHEALYEDPTNHPDHLSAVEEAEQNTRVAERNLRDERGSIEAAFDSDMWGDSGSEIAEIINDGVEEERSNDDILWKLYDHMNFNGDPDTAFAKSRWDYQAVGGDYKPHGGGGKIALFKDNQNPTAADVRAGRVEVFDTPEEAQWESVRRFLDEEGIDHDLPAPADYTVEPTEDGEWAMKDKDGDVIGTGADRGAAVDEGMATKYEDSNVADHWREMEEQNLPSFESLIESYAEKYQEYRDAESESFHLSEDPDIDNIRDQYDITEPSPEEYGLTRTGNGLARNDLPLNEVTSPYAANYLDTQRLTEAQRRALSVPEGTLLYADDGRYVGPGTTEKPKALPKAPEEPAPEGQQVLRFEGKEKALGVPKWQSYGTAGLDNYRELITLMKSNPLDTEATPSRHQYPTGVQHMARMGEFALGHRGETLPANAAGEAERVLHLAETQSDHINKANAPAFGENDADILPVPARGFRRVTTETIPERNLTKGQIRKIRERSELAEARGVDGMREIERQARRDILKFAQRERPDWRWPEKNNSTFAEVAAAHPDLSASEVRRRMATMVQHVEAPSNVVDLRPYLPEGLDAQEEAQALLSLRKDWLESKRGKALAKQYEQYVTMRRAAAQEWDDLNLMSPGDIRVENPRGEPDSPFKQQTDVARLAIQRLLTEAAESDIGTVSWANADAVTARWSEEHRPFYTALYDEMLPSAYKSALRWLGYGDAEIKAPVRMEEGSSWAASQGASRGSTYRDELGNRWQAKLPEDFAARVFRRGFPLLGLGAWMLSDALDPEQANAQEGPGGSTGLSLGKKVALGLGTAGALMLGGKAVKGALERGAENVAAGTLKRAAKEALTGAEVTGLPESLKRPGAPVPRTTTNEVARLGLSPDLTDEVTSRIAQERARLGTAGVVTHDETRARAAALLRTQGIDALKDLDPKRMTGPEVLGLASAAGDRAQKASALAAQINDPTLPLEHRAQLRDQMAKLDGEFVDLMTAAMRGSSEQGRALNANKLLANINADPTVWAMRAQRAIGPEGQLAPEQVAKIRQLVTDPDKTKLVSYIAGLRKASIPEQLVTLVNAGLFTRPAARVLDMVGGVGNVLVDQIVLSYPRAVYDYLIGKAITGQRTATAFGPSQVARMVEGAKQGIYETARNLGLPALKEGGWKSWVQAIRSAQVTPEMLNRYDIPKLTTIDMLSLARNPETLPNQAVDLAQKAIYRSLSVSDRPIHGAAYHGALQEAALAQAMTEGAKDVRARARELTSNPTEELRGLANHVADQLLFQNEDATAAISKAVIAAPGKAMRARKFGQTADLVDAAMKFQFPIVRTAANIAAKTTDYTAIGFGSGIYNIARAAVKTRAGLTAEARMAQRRAVEVLARATGGAGLLALGAYLADKGLMTGAAPTNSAERQQWRVEGKQPNSMLVNGEWVPIGRLPPGGTALALGATLHTMHQQGKATGLAAQGLAGLRTTLDQPLVTGTKTLLDAVRDPVGMGERYAEQQAGRVVPTALAMALQNAAGGGWRDPDGPAQAIEARIDPEGKLGLWPRIPEQRTALGDSITGAPGQSGLFNPFRGAEDRRLTDPVVAEAARAGWKPAGTKRLPTETNAEYEARVVQQGHEVRRALTARINSPTYQQAEAIARRLLERNPQGLAKLAADYDVPVPTTVADAANLVRRDQLQDAERIARRVSRTALADSLHRMAQP